MSVKKGFTIVELLVVIGIIAVLAAILTSALIYGVNYSKNAACESNLHQIHLAMTLYEQDNGYYPPYEFWDFAGTFESHFEMSEKALKPYAKSRMIYRCQDDPYFDRYNPYLWEVVHTSCSEVLNAFSVGQRLNVPVSEAPICLFNASYVPKPAACGLIRDYDYPVNDDFSKAGTAHGKFINTVYAAGHVKHQHFPLNFSCK